MAYKEKMEKSNNIEIKLSIVLTPNEWGGVGPGRFGLAHCPFVFGFTEPYYLEFT